MKTSRDVTVSRRAARKLLDGHFQGAPSELSRLLAAASSPPTAAELAAEQTALAHFHATGLGLPPHPRRKSTIKTTLAKLLTAKLLTLGAAAAAASGGIVALAASTGAVPAPFGHAHATTARSAETSEPTAVSSAPGATPTATSTDSAEPTFSSSSSSDSASGSASASASASSSSTLPTPSLAGLCHAYQAGATSNPGKALQNPAFSALVNAAGGSGNVGSFCITLIGAPAGHPGGAPSSHPGGAPSSHPAGAPSSHPAGALSSHPAGPPVKR